MTSEDKELITLDATKTTLLSSSPEFEAWVASLDPKHWAKYDLSACRLGWEAGRAALAAKPAPVGVKQLHYDHQAGSWIGNDRLPNVTWFGPAARHWLAA